MAVRDFLMDENGDLAVRNGDFATVSDAAAVNQGIKIRTRMFLGEYWLDESIGVPWFQEILIKNADPLVVRELIREAIASTPDVVAVIGAQLQQLPNRAAQIGYRVQTAFSTNPISAVIDIP